MVCTKEGHSRATGEDGQFLIVCNADMLMAAVVTPVFCWIASDKRRTQEAVVVAWIILSSYG